MTEEHADRFAELRAPAHWQAVEFISDLHLQPEEPETFQAWLAYLKRVPAERPDALFILGDLFEVWVGDDVLAPDESGTPNFWQICARALLEFSRTTPTYFIVGNRDFLLGDQAAKACGMQLLDDPCVLEMAGRRWLLSHGDALCLADTDYMRFRETVRKLAWKQSFLAQPLSERIAVARNLRNQSEARKRSTGADPTLWADVDASAALALLQHCNAEALIHGHTHRPAQHALGAGFSRHVLSDWDLAATPPRAEVLRLTAQGVKRIAVAKAP